MEQIHKILAATFFDICGGVICVCTCMDVTVYVLTINYTSAPTGKCICGACLCQIQPV